MIQAKLKLEIMAGYLVLLSCLAFIICLVYEEREKKSVMERQDRKKYEPDFSLILSGEDNRREMLGLFIGESRKDPDTLTDCGNPGGHPGIGKTDRIC